jgi:hypothetical protein
MPTPGQQAAITYTFNLIHSQHNRVVGNKTSARHVRIILRSLLYHPRTKHNLKSVFLKFVFFKHRKGNIIVCFFKVCFYSLFEGDPLQIINQFLTISINKINNNICTLPPITYTPITPHNIAHIPTYKR